MGAVSGEGNVPTALSSLVGRTGELEAMAERWANSRLLSLVGPGGCGKSRLALEFAGRMGGTFVDGAWWVELGSVTEGGLVSDLVAVTVDLRQAPGEDPLGLLARQWGRRQLMLVLDNCEHVVAECAEMVERLLRACPGLKVLTTSREVIGVTGEQVFRLEGLDTGAEGSGPSSSEAVALFVERARAAAPGLSPDAVEVAVIGGICRQLDGLPLAIELAAARAGVLSVAEIASRLQDPGLLRHPSRTAPARHLTMDAVLEWSYRLLSPLEQTLFVRLSVFQGSFSLLAGESVASGGDIEAKEVLPLLSALVDRSLVRVVERRADNRYRMLQTIRAYGEARLAASADSAAVRQAHSEFYAGLALQGQVGLEGPDQARWLQLLDTEHDNLRAVLRRSLPAIPEQGGRLAAMLWPFWYRRGYYHEARGWLEEAVDLSGEMSPPVAADVLTGAGVLAFLQCEYAVATDRLERAVTLHQRDQHRVGVATALQRLGSIAREQGRYDDARRLHESSRRIWVELGDLAGVAASEDYLCFVAWLKGDLDAAEEHGVRALAYFEEAGRDQETAAVLVNLGATAHYRHDDQTAAALLRRAVSISRQIGYPEGLAWAAHELGSITVGTDPSAGSLLCESLTVHVELGDCWRTASVIETIAARTLTGPDPTLALRLLGACDALREALGAPIPPVERPAVDEALADLRARLGAGGYLAAWEEGRSLRLDQAVDLAGIACRLTAPGPASATDQPKFEAAVGEGGSSDRRAAGPNGELTEREVEVLRLVSRGLTNREIAQQLFISTGTAGVHVSNILRKLGVTSRVQAAMEANRLGVAD